MLNVKFYHKYICTAQKQALEEQRQINMELEEKNNQSNLKLSRIASILQEKIDK